MKNYSRYKDNQNTRKSLRREGFTNIKIENGQAVKKEKTRHSAEEAKRMRLEAKKERNKL